MPSADQPSARRSRSSFDRPRGAARRAGAIRQPPEQLWISCSIDVKMMRWPSGVQSGPMVPGRVGRQLAPSFARARSYDPDIVVWVASASRLPSGDTRTLRYALGGRPGSGEARPWRSTDTTGCRPATPRHAWDVDERAVRGHGDASVADGCRHHALEHRRGRPYHLQAFEIEPSRRGTSLRRRRRGARRHVVAWLPPRMRTLDVPVRRSSTATCRCRCRRWSEYREEHRLASGRNSGHR